MAAFATFEELRDYSRQPNLDPIYAQLLLDLGSDEIRSACFWNLSQETTTETLDGNGMKRLYLRTKHLTAVSSVTEDAIALTFDTDYEWGKNGTLFKCHRWVRGFRNVVVAYTHGYVAGSVEMNTLKKILMDRCIVAMTNPGGALTSEALGAVSFTYAQAASALNAAPIDQDARLHRFVLVGWFA